jgi:Lipocalin-like domain
MRWKSAATVTLLVVAGSVSARAQGSPSLEGAWRVTEFVATGANAETIKSPQPGLYIFTKRHYSIVTVGGTAPRKDFGAARDPENLSDAEKIARYAAWEPFAANAGTYQVSGNILTTRAEVAKNPGVMTGPPIERTFRIEGKTLTLIRKPAAGQPARETTTTLTRVE